MQKWRDTKTQKWVVYKGAANKYDELQATMIKKETKYDMGENNEQIWMSF